MVLKWNNWEKHLLRPTEERKDYSLSLSLSLSLYIYIWRRKCNNNYDIHWINSFFFSLIKKLFF
ncbi:hypothetical protein ACMBCM_09140, partial [Spiroplasma sp. K1]